MQAFNEFLERKGYRKPQVSQENLLRLFVVCASISSCLWLMLCHPKVLAIKLPRSGASGSPLSCVLEVMEGVGLLYSQTLQPRNASRGTDHQGNWKVVLGPL